MDDLVAMRIQSLQEGGGKAARGSEARSRRNIRERRNLDLRRAQVLHGERFANDGVFHVRDPIDVFERGILEVDAGGERPSDGHVYVLVDGGRHQKAFALAIIRLQVGASAPQGDAQRTTRDDHARAA